MARIKNSVFSDVTSGRMSVHTGSFRIRAATSGQLQFFGNDSGTRPSRIVYAPLYFPRTERIVSGENVLLKEGFSRNILDKN